MSPRFILFVRLLLLLMALSLAFVAARKGQQAIRYFSELIELPGTVVSAELTDAIPLAWGNPKAPQVTQPIPTRMAIMLREFPGLRFMVALRENPELIPPPPNADENVTLLLPARWRESVVGDRALAMGLKRGGNVLVDPAGYPWAAEYRTAFLAVGAAVGAVIAALGAWRIGRR
jgi:hypothetical protein